MKEEIQGVQICTTAYLKKTGFNFSAYDYMANLTIGDITFKNCKIIGTQSSIYMTKSFADALAMSPKVINDALNSSGSSYFEKPYFKYF